MTDIIHSYPFLISRTEACDNPILNTRIKVSFSLYIAAERKIGINIDNAKIG